MMQVDKKSKCCAVVAL